ncbi:MAG: winged helix-turn-helix transcriptional regulator [Euryarchaeota archaeon]|nr:winged helix-turn-helix transcriptional regulator [Euryarchaeota archaeon]
MKPNRLVPFVIALAALLVATSIAQAAADPLQPRKAEYQETLADLPLLQNDDGGFGPARWVDNNTTLATLGGTASYRETVFTTLLLIEERTDPLATQKNANGNETSLAASNVPNARDWLRGQEADTRNTIAPGDLALFALAYGMLGDSNADRLLDSLLARERDQPGNLSIDDANKILFAVAYADLAVPPAHNETIAGLTDRSANATYDDIEGTAWALLGHPGDASLKDRLVLLIEHDGDSATRDALALATLALVLSGQNGSAADADAWLAHLHGHPPGSLGTVYRMLAERMAHPEFSPHYVAPPPTFGGERPAIAGAPADDGTPTDIEQALARINELEQRLQETQAPSADDATFPVPTWVMMGILLSALAALGAVGLAWGLKRDQLTGIRRNVFDYIEKNPGEHFSKIRRELGIAPGTFQHHLTVLEQEGWITSHKDARYKRYFVNGNRFQKIIGGKTTQEYKQKFSALQNPTTQDVVRYLQLNPGATQKMVAQRLNLHASTVNWHAKRLKEAGLLMDERVGKEVRYKVDGDMVDKIIEAPMAA